MKVWLKEDADYLCNAIEANFHYAVNNEGKNYCRLMIDWYYKLEYTNIFMPKYVPSTLKLLYTLQKLS